MTARDWYYKREPERFLRGIVGLAPELLGTYSLVLELIYQYRGPIANDPRWIGGFMGISGRRCAALINELLRRKRLVLRDGKLSDEHAEIKLAERDGVSQKRADSGAEGGRKSGISRSKSPRNVGEMPANTPRTGQLPMIDAGENNRLGEASASYARAIGEERRGDRESESRTVVPFPARADLDFSSIGQISGWIMRQARMVRPPDDYVIIEGWIEAGADFERHIKPTVQRMAGRAKGTIRNFTYFDKEIRAAAAADAGQRSADDAYFDSVAERMREYGLTIPATGAAKT